MVFRPKMTPGLDVPTLLNGHLAKRALNLTDLYTMLAVLLRVRRLPEEANSTRLRPAAFARYSALSAA